MGIALGALHRLAGAGEAADLHREMKAFEVEHPMARLFQQGGSVRRRRSTGAQTDDDEQAGRKGAGRRSAGVHQALRIRSSPTRRVTFCASSHSSKGRT